MAGDELAIQQFHPGMAQRSHQPCQCDFRCVGDAAEHAFSAEHPVEAHAIEAADQLAALPAFDRMGMAGGMQSAITGGDPFADPAIRMVGPGSRAGGDYIVERGIAGDGEPLAPERFCQRA